MITPYDPYETVIQARLQSPSWDHLMGTDWLGRDVFSRLIWGTRSSMIVGMASVALGTTVGSLIGVVSGYLGGKTDSTVQAVMDMFLAFPALIMALAIMAVLGNSMFNVILAISIPTIPRANRVVRSVALSIREMQYVEAAKAIGGNPVHIIIRQIIPNCLAPYLIVATSFLATAIMIEASLSFLGLGASVTDPTWGRSLSQAMPYIQQASWLVVFPAIVISVIVFVANMFGDGLRDYWDPRLKRI